MEDAAIAGSFYLFIFFLTLWVLNIKQSIQGLPWRGKCYVKRILWGSFSQSACACMQFCQHFWFRTSGRIREAPQASYRLQQGSAPLKKKNNLAICNPAISARYTRSITLYVGHEAAFGECARTVSAHDSHKKKINSFLKKLKSFFRRKKKNAVNSSQAARVQVRMDTQRDGLEVLGILGRRVFSSLPEACSETRCSNFLRENNLFSAFHSVPAVVRLVCLALTSLSVTIQRSFPEHSRQT